MTDSLAVATEIGSRKDRSPANAIGVRVLLVSGDIQIIDTLCEFMGKMAMHVDILLRLCLRHPEALPFQV